MNKDGKLFEMLETDVSCVKKDIRYGIDDRPMHNHDGYEAIFLLNGTAIVETEGGRRQIREGDLVVLRSGTLHHGEPDNRHRYDRVVINVKESTARQMLTKRPELKKAFGYDSCYGAWVCHLNSKNTDEFMDCSDSLEHILGTDEYGSDVLAREILYRMLVLINRLNGEEIGSMDGVFYNEKQKLVQMVQAYIDLHLSDDLSLLLLEKVFLYSGSYLSKCFKLVTGMSLQYYIIKKRICLAKHCIEKGMELKDVCDYAGFGNYSNFSRTFLSYAGESPMEYRKRTR